MRFLGEGRGGERGYKTLDTPNQVNGQSQALTPGSKECDNNIIVSVLVGNAACLLQKLYSSTLSSMLKKSKRGPAWIMYSTHLSFLEGRQYS